MLIVDRIERKDGASYHITKARESKGTIIFRTYYDFLEAMEDHLGEEFDKDKIIYDTDKKYKTLTKYYTEIAFDYGCLVWDLHDYETASFWQRLKYLFTKKL